MGLYMTDGGKMIIILEKVDKLIRMGMLLMAFGKITFFMDI